MSVIISTEVKTFLFLIAICCSFFVSVPVYRYAAYRVCLGPEEELDKRLLNLGTIGAMAACRKNGAVFWGFSVVSAVLWGTTFIVYGCSWLSAQFCIVMSLLLGLSLVDIRINELPPLLNLGIAVIGAIRMSMDLVHWYDYVIGAVAVSGLFLLVGLFSKGKAMGGGDVKLMAALGLLLGWKKILLVLVIGAVSGVIVHGTLMIVRKEDHVLAFGPYLAMGGGIAMLWGDELISGYLRLVLK